MAIVKITYHIACMLFFSRAKQCDIYFDFIRLSQNGRFGKYILGCLYFKEGLGVTITVKGIIYRQTFATPD